MTDTASEPMISHLVYFSLKDNSTAGIEKQIALCRKYLTDHPGTVKLAVGTRTVGLNREVNDKEFDVCVHVLFKNRAAHDAYQVHPRHLQFIEESKPGWDKARVFDADVS